MTCEERTLAETLSAYHVSTVTNDTQHSYLAHWGPLSLILSACKVQGFISF